MDSAAQTYELIRSLRRLIGAEEARPVAEQAIELLHSGNADEALVCVEAAYHDALDHEITT